MSAVKIDKQLYTRQKPEHNNQNHNLKFCSVSVSRQLWSVKFLVDFFGLLSFRPSKFSENELGTFHVLFLDSLGVSSPNGARFAS